MYRLSHGVLEVLLVHPGGPFWKNKDSGSWVVPRGAVEEDEDIFAAAQREFNEETGLVSSEPFIDLGEVKHRSSKRIRVWAFEGECDPETIKSNTFEMEWPPKSGKLEAFPEIDKAGFFRLSEARKKMLESETPFLERLAKHFPADALGKDDLPPETLFG